MYLGPTPDQQQAAYKAIGYTPSPTGAIRNVQLQGGEPASFLQPNAQQANNVAQSGNDLGSQVLNLLKQYQQYGQSTLNQANQETYNRTTGSLPSDLSGMNLSPSDILSFRKGESNAIQPTIGGAKDVLSQAKDLITQYKTGQEQSKKDAMATVKDAIAQYGSNAFRILDPEVTKLAGYNKDAVELATHTLKQQELELKQRNATLTNDNTPYIQGVDASVDAYVKGVNDGTYKMSDIPKQYKNRVAQGIAAAHSSGADDILGITQTSLKELNDMVAQNRGFSGAVGAKGLSSIFGLRSEPIPGTEAANFAAKLKQVTQDVILPNLKILHGLGRVTDREFQSLQNAITSLSPNLSETEFKKQLKNITDMVNAKVGKSGGGGQTLNRPQQMQFKGKILNLQPDGTYK